MKPTYPKESTGSRAPKHTLYATPILSSFVKKLQACMLKLTSRLFRKAAHLPTQGRSGIRQEQSVGLFGPLSDWQRQRNGTDWCQGHCVRALRAGLTDISRFALANTSACFSNEHLVCVGTRTSVICLGAAAPSGSFSILFLRSLMPATQHTRCILPLNHLPVDWL